MSDSTLAQIKKKVRRMTASPSTNQLSEADLEEYINTFYENDLPSHLKIWNLHDTYTFYTQENIDEYSFNTDTYHAVLPPVFVDGFEVFYSQSREQFFNIYPNLVSEQTGPSGDGSAGAYTFTIGSLPFLQRSLVIYAKDTNGVTHTAHDVPQAANNLVGDLFDTSTGAQLVGSVDYVTGVTSVTWPNTIAITEKNHIKYTAVKASRPAAMLFFKDKFILRPIPDKVYTVTVDVYRKPTQLMSGGSNSVSPDVNQWWQYVAIGAAIKVFQDRQDMESVQNVMPFFREQEALILYRTATQQAPERTGTIYTSQLGLPVGNRSFGGR